MSEHTAPGRDRERWAPRSIESPQCVDFDIKRNIKVREIKSEPISSVYIYPTMHYERMFSNSSNSFSKSHFAPKAWQEKTELKDLFFHSVFRTYISCYRNAEKFQKCKYDEIKQKNEAGNIQSRP